MTNNKLFILALVIIVLIGALSIVLAVQGKYSELFQFLGVIGGGIGVVLFGIFLLFVMGA